MPSSEDARGPARAGPSRRARLLVTLAAPLVGLLACELYVRARGLAPLALPVQRGNASVEDPDPVLRYRPRPGGVQVVRYEDAPGAQPCLVKAHVDALGCRAATSAAATAPTPAPGVLRIACLGDSHTFGFGVADDETWPAALQRELDARRAPEGDALPCEVLNAGVNGYDSEQELLWLERGVLPLEPQLVLWQYFVNDVAMRDLALDPVDQRGALHQLLASREEGFVGWLRRRSQALDLVCARVFQRLNFDLFASARERLYDDESPAWARVRAALVNGRELCAQRGVRLLVVLFPYLHRRDERLSSAEPLAKVEAFCRAQGIDVLDLGPVFEPLPVESLRVHPNDLHFGAAAYALAAERIAAALAAEPRWLAH